MKFSIPKRYDESLADAGVEFRIEDDNGNYFGTFKCRLVDEYSQKGELTYKRIRQKYAAQIKSKKMNDYEALKVVFVEASLVDWSGILDDKGKEVPFSIENALAYFEHEETRWVLVQLTRLAADITNFALEPVTEEATKN